MEKNGVGNNLQVRNREGLERKCLQCEMGFEGTGSAGKRREERREAERERDCREKEKSQR